MVLRATSDQAFMPIFPGGATNQYAQVEDASHPTPAGQQKSRWTQQQKTVQTGRRVNALAGRTRVGRAIRAPIKAAMEETYEEAEGQYDYQLEID